MQGDICSNHTEAGRGADPSLNCSATLLPPPAGELRQHGWSLRLIPELLQLFSSGDGVITFFLVHTCPDWDFYITNQEQFTSFSYFSEEGKNVKLAVQIEAQSGKLFVGDKVLKEVTHSSYP